MLSVYFILSLFLIKLQGLQCQSFPAHIETPQVTIINKEKSNLKLKIYGRNSKLQRKSSETIVSEEKINAF